MCGIAGVIYKKPGLVGKSLVAMLSGIQHRGPDSTGVALYSSEDELLKIWMYYRGGEIDDVLLNTLRDELFRLTGWVSGFQRQGEFVFIKVKYQGDLKFLCDKLEAIQGVHIISIGTALEVFKDEGSAEKIDQKFNLSNFSGTHGIGHTRLATESEVDIRTAHPFWAYGFNNVAIVHNGQLTNYYTLRRRFEKKGYRFRTGNDSEMIAVYIADQMSAGHSLRTALEQSMEEFDGTFSYLVSTLSEMGFAKDRLGVKPMVILEGEEVTAIASEEVALRRVFSDKDNFNVFEPGPGEVMTWSR